MTPARPRLYGSALVRAGWPLSVGAVLVILAVWQWRATAADAPVYLISLGEIADDLYSLTTDGRLPADVAESLSRQLPGFLLGAVSGAGLGLLAGVSRFGERALDSWVSMTYPLPKFALFPVLVLWLGYTDSARISVIAIAVFYPVFINSYAGTRSVPERMMWVSRNFQASRVRIFAQVVARGAMPSVVVGVRIGLALSFIMTFATESVGVTEGGLGALILDGFEGRQFGWMYAGIIMFGALGFLADRLWGLAARYLTQGQMTASAGYG